MNTPALLLLCLLCVLLSATHSMGKNLLGTPTPLSLPGSISSGVDLQDVYADQSKDVFLISARSGGFASLDAELYQLDYLRTSIIAKVSLPETETKIYTDLADTQDAVYMIGWDGGTIYRFSVANITDYTSVYLNFSDTTFGIFNIALHPTRNLLFLISLADAQVCIFNATTLEQLSSFNYAQGDFAESLQTPSPGGFGLTIDASRDLLYISTGGAGCFMSFTPGVVWSYDISDVNNVVLKDNIVWGPAACLDQGAVDVVTGRAWLGGYHWIGGFALEDLSYDSSHSLQVMRPVSDLAYDASSNTAYWATSAWNTAHGYIYRSCMLEESPQNVHEITAWGNSSVSLTGFYFEKEKETLYITHSTVQAAFHTGWAAVFAVSINGTDCAQTLEASPASIVSSPFWLNFVQYLPTKIF